jgi:hypothetical protein
MGQIAYGIEVQRENDPWLKLADDTVAIFTRVTVPGAFLVDSIPLRKHLRSMRISLGSTYPTRVSAVRSRVDAGCRLETPSSSVEKDSGRTRGRPVRLRSRENRRYSEHLSPDPDTHHFQASGTFKPCIVSDLLADHPKPEDAQAVRNVGAIIYAAGADTVRASCNVFHGTRA